MASNQKTQHNAASDGVAAHSRAGDIEIPPEEWIQFFDNFSRQHEGWLASVMVTQGNEQKWEIKERQLAGISSDHLTARDEIYISVDRDGGGQLTHPIRHPTRVEFRRDLEGAHAGIDITSAEGMVTSIRFRIAARPETLDGIVDFPHETGQANRWKPGEQSKRRRVEGGGQSARSTHSDRSDPD
jgi:hypothetical protein